MKKLTKWFAATSFAATMLAGGVVSADHSRYNPLVALSEDLRCQADELRTAFRDQFRQSAVYNELMWKSHELKNTAARVRSLARSGGCSMRMGQEVESLRFLIEDMASLVEVARLRAARGLDRPLCGCTRHVDAKLARMRQTVVAMQRSLYGNRYFGPYDRWDGRAPYGRHDSWHHDDYRHTSGYRGIGYGGELAYGREAPSYVLNGPRDRAGVEFGGDGGIVVNVGGASFRVR